jgi:hypothetical protein
MLQSDYIEVDGERILHYYLCHYKPMSSGFDRLSKSLIRFKNGSLIDLKAWTSCVIESLPATLLSKPIIVRALGSLEIDIVGNYSPLDHIGKRLAAHLQGYYLPSLLSKRTITPAAKTLTRREREEVFTNLYSFEGTDFPSTTILVLDDIVTTGMTLRAIIRSIRKILPTISIISYTLASTEWHSQLNARIDLQSGQYQWKDQLGWSIVNEDVPANIAIQELRASIQNNFSDPA